MHKTLACGYFALIFSDLVWRLEISLSLAEDLTCGMMRSSFT